MTFGIVSAIIASLYQEPNWHSPLIGQILYGDTIEIVQQQQQWALIRWDNQKEIWINVGHYLPITAKEFQKLNNQENHLSFDIYANAISSQAHIPLILGSRLPHFDGLSYRMNGKKIIYNGQVIKPDFNNLNLLLPKIALKYLNSPKLAGGRSPFGIDDIGLVQMIYRFFDIPLPSQLNQLKLLTEAVTLFGGLEIGNLVFFNTALSEKVGVIISENELIYCDATVQIHKMDSHGIFDHDEKKYIYRINDIRKVNQAL